MKNHCTLHSLRDAVRLRDPWSRLQQRNSKRLRNGVPGAHGQSAINRRIKELGWTLADYHYHAEVYRIERARGCKITDTEALNHIRTEAEAAYK